MKSSFSARPFSEGRSLCGAALLFLLAGSASANNFYTFTYSDGTNISNGTLNTTGTPGSLETAVGGTMQITSCADVTELGAYTLIPGSGLSPLGGFFYDNQLNQSMNPIVFNNGLLFGNGGTNEINIFGNFMWGETAWGGSFRGGPGTFAMAPVPEPTSIAAVGIGLFLVTRRRRVKRA